MSDGKEYTAEVKMVELELDLNDSTIEFLEFLAKETGLTYDKVIEYSIANMLLSEAGKKFHKRP